MMHLRVLCRPEGTPRRMKQAVTLKQSARQNALFLLKVVAEVIDPVMGSSQLGHIERQIRTIEATNIRVMNLLLVLYPFIDRLQAGDRLVKPLRK